MRGTTSDAYASASFDSLGADAVTLSPYMGWDTLDAFVNPKGHGGTKGAFVLCKTSNPSSSEVQCLRIATGGRAVFERLHAAVNDEFWGNSGVRIALVQPIAWQVAELTNPGNAWNKFNNIGLVVGATDVAAISAVRRCNTQARSNRSEALRTFSWAGVEAGSDSRHGFWHLEWELKVACCRASIRDDGAQPNACIGCRLCDVRVM
eukprot:3569245-Amphidinium_carterae.1